MERYLLAMLSCVFLSGVSLADAADLSRAGGNWDEESAIEWIPAKFSSFLPTVDRESPSLIEQAGAVEDISTETSFVNHQGGCCPGAPCDWLRPCSGIFAEYQNVWLRPQISEPESGGSTTSYFSGQRVIFGHINSCGDIWRIRYFNYAATTFRSNSVFNLEYADFEHARRFSLGRIHGELSAGLRWAEWNERGDYSYTETLGPVIGGEIRGPSVFNWTTFATARQSIQFGDLRSENRQLGSFAVSEMQLGAIRNVNLFGHPAFVKGFLEAQYWVGPQNDDSQALGLVGLGASFGTTF
jgi:hypothetical protein